MEIAALFNLYNEVYQKLINLSRDNKINLSLYYNRLPTDNSRNISRVYLYNKYLREFNSWFVPRTELQNLDLETLAVINGIDYIISNNIESEFENKLIVKLNNLTPEQVFNLNSKSSLLRNLPLFIKIKIKDLYRRKVSENIVRGNIEEPLPSEIQRYLSIYYNVFLYRRDSLPTTNENDTSAMPRTIDTNTPIELASYGEIELATENTEDEVNYETTDRLNKEVHDLNVRYSGCYCKRKNDNKVLYFSEFDVYNGRIRVSCSEIFDGHFGNSSLKTFNKEDYDFTLPKLGLINYKNQILYVERLHRKNGSSRYRKGFRSELININVLSKIENNSLGINNELDEYSNTHIHIVNNIIDSLFNPVTFSYEQALESVLNNRRLGAAFSSSLGVRLDSVRNNIVIHKNNWIIGKYNNRINKFVLQTNIFNRDLDSYNIKYIEARK